MKNSELLKKAIKKGLKMGHLDIETSPSLVYTYGTYGVYISPEQIKEHQKVTSLVYQQEGSNDCVALMWDSKKKDDRKLLEKCSDGLNGFDVIIGQNVCKFDIAKLNWRLNLHGLPKVDVLTIDTLLNSRKVFKPESHKLDFKSRAYGYGGKIKQTMEDAIRVAEGDEKASRKRLLYNIKDVKDCRKMFWKEVDYYVLPRALVNMLKLFINTDNPTFCIKCAANHFARFDVKKVSQGSYFKMTCNRCDYTWKIDKEV